MTITQFILIVSLFNFALGFYVLKNDPKNALNRWFGLCSFQLGIWVFQNYLFQLSTSIFILRSIYALAPFIVISGLSWISYFRNGKISLNLQRLNVVQFLINVVFAVLMMTSNKMIISAESYTSYQTGPLFGLYTIYMIVVLICFISYIVAQYVYSNAELRKRFRFILAGILIMVSTSALVGFILPAMNISQYNMLDSPSSIFFVLLGAYSIVNNKFLDIRSAATEIIAYFLVILMFVFLFVIGEHAGIGLKLALFTILIFSSYLLVKSVQSEVFGREKIERLAKRLEKDKKDLVDLDRMKDEFLQMATHELNTPITVIQGKLSMAIDENMCHLDGEQKKFLTPILTDTMRLSNLSKDILNVARIDQNRLTINPSETDLDVLIFSIVSELSVHAKERGNSIAYIKFTKEPIKLTFDQSKITEVVTNLINNANKFTDKGKITVTSKIKDGFVIISVADTGIGIEKEEQKHLFEKFYQSGRFDPKNPREQQGSGLGLYISKNIVDLHRGKIWLESEKGRGSTFYFSLPLEYKEIVQSSKLHSDGSELRIL